MGCFSTCFGKSKHKRRVRRRLVKTSPSLLDHLQKNESIEDFQVSHLVEEENPEKPICSSPDSSNEKANTSERKKVTFDLNVKIYEDIPREAVEEEVKGNEEEDSSSSSLFSYPSNHRYQNCRDSDDEFDEILSSDEESEVDYYSDDDDYDYDNDDINDEMKPVISTQEQSSESLFSLSIDSRKHKLMSETGDKEVSSPMPIKNNPPPRIESNREYEIKFVDSVMNPVENVAQWKVMKARSRYDHQAKENFNEDFRFPVRKEKEKEITVDTSLSSWLVDNETSSVSVGNSGSEKSKITGTSSPNCCSKFEDRPILGALTVEEIRQFSALNSPRKSPRGSPDDMPIIGTVGSYWSHTGQTTNSGSITRSRSRITESTKVIWDSTPFETRLEKALEQEGGSAEQIIKA